MSFENLWPDLEEFDNLFTPKEILEKQSEFLLTATKMLIYAEIENTRWEFGDLLPTDEEIKDFNFHFTYSLKSKAIWEYKFILFSFYHDISIYPTKIRLDSLISKELEITTKYVTVDNEDEFTDLLAKILHSNRTKTVIASMIKLSK